MACATGTGTDAPFCACDESTSSLPAQLTVGARDCVAAASADACPGHANAQATPMHARRYDFGEGIGRSVKQRERWISKFEKPRLKALHELKRRLEGKHHG